MATTTRRRSWAFRPSSSRRRKLVWARFSNFGGTLATATTTVIDPLAETETEIGGEIYGCTIMALRGTIYHSISGAAAPAVDATAKPATALIVLGSDTLYSSTRDITAVGRWDDWFFYVQSVLHAPQTLAAGVQPATSWHQRHEVMGRSRRKLDEIGSRLNLVTTNPVGSPAIVWGGSLSILLALP